MSQNTLKVLQEARAKIDKGWVRGRLHDSGGYEYDYSYQHSTYVSGDRYCAIGAINASSGLLSKFRAAGVLRKEIGFHSRSIMSWNDNARDKEQVLHGFDKAIKAERERLERLSPFAQVWDRHFSNLAEKAKAKLPHVVLSAVPFLQQQSLQHRLDLVTLAAAELAEAEFATAVEAILVDDAEPMSETPISAVPEHSEGTVGVGVGQ